MRLEREGKDGGEELGTVLRSGERLVERLKVFRDIWQENEKKSVLEKFEGDDL